MNISLSSVLLFALVIPFVMTYRISPGDTPYWLFGIVFFAILSYFLLDLLKFSKEKNFRIKSVLLWFVIFATIGTGFISAIIVRHNVAPVYMIHDIILQLEEAIRFFLNGVNPYATTYFGTFLEQWNYSPTEVNPALYHFVMQPFYLLFSLPFYYVSVHTIGYFDGRIPLFFLFLTLLVMAFVLVKDKEKKLLFVTLLAFNPAMLTYTLEGRSDIFMFSFLFGAFYLLYLKKYSLAGISMALAFAIKQSVWPILPFYLLYLYFKNKNIKKTLKQLLLFIIVFLIIIAPFLIWDARAFVESTVLYLSGFTSHSYPVSGYGLGMFLHEIGVIKDVHAYYPFVLWQTIIGVPLFVVLAMFLRKEASVRRLILVYGIFLFVYWYLSRYFNNSHLGYLSMVFITMYFWPEDK